MKYDDSTKRLLNEFELIQFVEFKAISLKRVGSISSKLIE